MPVWNRTISLGAHVKSYKDGDIDIPRLAELVVGCIEKSGWIEDSPYPDTLRDHLNRLKQASSEGEYRAAFEGVYDVADDERVWIETH